MEEKRSWIHKSISVLLLLLIAAFSLSSIGNVTEYIHKWHVGGWGWVLGIGFGAVVFICAYLASISVSRSNTWWIAIVVGSIFGVTSASFQASIYIDGGAPWPTAGALSFIPIIVGEVGLALLESSFSRDHARQIEASIVTQLNATIAQLNNTIAQIEATVQDLTNKLHTAQANAAQIEQLHATRYTELETAHATQLEQLHATHAGDVQSMTRELNELDGKLTSATRENTRLNSELHARVIVPTPKATQSTQTDADRVQRVLDFYVTHPGGSLRDAATHADCSTGTVRADADRLVAQKKLNKVDGKYYPAINDTPVIAQPYTNGHSTKEI